MKQLVMVGALVGVLGTPLPAMAAPGNGAATPFKAQYPTLSTVWTCSGARIVNNVSVKDSETCLITGDATGFVAGSYSGAPWGTFPGYGPTDWVSDFDNALSSSWAITLVANTDGTFTATIVAYYAS